VTLLVENLLATLGEKRGKLGARINRLSAKRETSTETVNAPTN